MQELLSPDRRRQSEQGSTNISGEREAKRITFDQDLSPTKGKAVALRGDTRPTNDAKVKEELDLQEVIPNVNIECIKKATKAAQNGEVPATPSEFGGLWAHSSR